jgi:hypothetical protein
VFGEMGRVNLTALKYLIIHLNTRQTIFEFEILPTPAGSRLVSLLDGRMVMNRDFVLVTARRRAACHFNACRGNLRDVTADLRRGKQKRS